MREISFKIVRVHFHMQSHRQRRVGAGADQCEKTVLKRFSAPTRVLHSSFVCWYRGLIFCLQEITMNVIEQYLKYPLLIFSRENL